MIRNWFQRRDKGNVAVEFALITALFTLPLLLGAVDFVTIIAAKAQLNTALQALYYFAVNNPTDAIDGSTSYVAGTGGIIPTINSNSDFQLSVTTQQLEYSCYTTGTTASEATAPSVSALSTTDCSAAGNTTMTFANYVLTASVPLPISFYMLGLNNPMQLSASGSVQIATKNN